MRFDVPLNGITQIKTIDLSNVPGYQYLTAGDIFLDAKYFNSASSGIPGQITSKVYNAETGILSCYVLGSNDNRPTDNPRRTAILIFDVICI